MNKFVSQLCMLETGYFYCSNVLRAITISFPFFFKGFGSGGGEWMIIRGWALTNLFSCQAGRVLELIW